MPDAVVMARTGLLEASTALGAHLDALVLIGARAIYLHTGATQIALAEFTTDGDVCSEHTAARDSHALARPCARCGALRAISASLAPFGDLKVDQLFPGLASALAAIPKIAVPGTALTEIARNLAGASVWQSVTVPEGLWSGVEEVLRGTAELAAFAAPRVASEFEQAVAVIDLEPLLTGDEEGAAAVVAQVETAVAASPLLAQLSASDIRFISVLVGLLVLVAGMGMYAAVATTDDLGDYLLAGHAAASSGIAAGGLAGKKLRKVGQQDTGTDGTDQAAIDP